MENFIKSLPKPVLAMLVIAAALIFFVLNDPPHTVCQVQADNFRDALKGDLFPATVNKNKIPPIIDRAQEACQLGNSSGSCLEYFNILRKTARDLKNFSSECMSELAGIPEVRRALTEGATLMAKMAWGSQAPEQGMARFGWLQESEIGLFCLMKDVYSQSFGEEAWKTLRGNIYKELPGEALRTAPGLNLGDGIPKAVDTMAENEIWARSLFSVRCENFR